MKKIKIKVYNPSVNIASIPLGQIFTGSIEGQLAWLFVKVEIKEGVPVILSLISNGSYGEFWEDPPIQNYQPIEFERF